jgi:hypothetical protein
LSVPETLDGMFENPAWTQPYFDDAVAAFQAEAMQWADARWLGGSLTTA